MVRNKIYRFGLILLSLALLCALLGGCADSSGEVEVTDDIPATAEPTATPEPTYNPEFVIEPPSLWDDEPGGETEEDTLSTPEIEDPGVQPPDVPEQEAADDEFFSDAAFVGNSLVDGFRMYSGLTTCDYYAATSMTVLGVGSTYAITLENGAAGTIYQGLAQHEYGKIYILLGINEIGYEPEYFKELYRDMMEQMFEINPDATYYIMGLTPVSYYKSSTSSTFNMANVNAYNEQLRSLAEELGCYYLDLCGALAGDDGYLPSDVTSDGIHFIPSYYQNWLDFIRTHYV